MMAMIQMVKSLAVMQMNATVLQMAQKVDVTPVVLALLVTVIVMGAGTFLIL